MDEDVVIKVDNVYKDFVLPHERAGSVKGIFTSMLREATKKKETQHALKDISFEIKKGEFFGIVGRNGSGKSTLLKILAGIYQPTKGSIQTKGKLVPFIELGVGFNPELTGKDNVYLNGAMLGFSEKEIDDMYKDIVEFAELERFMDQKLKNYSSGMQVRLAFSMAIRSEADILLLDEVLAVGDADFQRKCYDYFQEIKSKNITVVFVSHDMNAVREYCDRATLIDNNVLIDIGNTDTIAQKYIRLFMNEQSSKKKTSDKRWGDGALNTTRVSTKIYNNYIEISTEFKANKDFERPIAGFRIRDLKQKEIMGTNTKQEQVKIPSLKKDDKITVSWKLPNILKDGEYSIDIALQYPDEITVADWWNDAKRLIIRKERHLPYDIDPGFITKIIQ